MNKTWCLNITLCYNENQGCSLGLEHLGLETASRCFLTSRSCLDTVNPISWSCLGPDTLTSQSCLRLKTLMSRYCLGVGIIHLIYTELQSSDL